MRPLEVALRDGLGQMELQVSDAQVHQLLDYLALIQKWNQVYNLTAVREPHEMLTHHLLDSLSVLVPLRRQLEGLVTDGASSPADAVRMLDVGSGAGLPGVVVAICCPDILVDCVDTVAKKAAFIQQVAVQLRLPNLRGLHSRVERLTQLYTVVASRAFASLVDFTQWSRGALGPGAIWMGMKGKMPTEEIAQLPADVDVFHVEQLQVPGLDAQRCIVWMRAAGAEKPGV